MADVAAQLREWNEHLARIGDQPPMPAIAQSRRCLHQFGERHPLDRQAIRCSHSPHTCPVSVVAAPGVRTHLRAIPSLSILRQRLTKCKLLEAPMQIGFNAPTAGPLADPEILTQICVGGEAMGFDYATFSDHIVIPTNINARYPYSETGEFPSGSAGDRHEQFTEATFIAAKTSRLRLVTSAAGVPPPPAGFAAKILSTTFVLSGRRLT